MPLSAVPGRAVPGTGRAVLCRAGARLDSYIGHPGLRRCFSLRRLDWWRGHQNLPSPAWGELRAKLWNQQPEPGGGHGRLPHILEEDESWMALVIASPSEIPAAAATMLLLA